MKMFAPLLFFIVANLTVSAQDKGELLLRAVSDGDSAMVEKLIKAGADVNHVKSIGPWMKLNALTLSINTGKFEIAKILIEHNADVNWKDGFDTSAIIYAAAIGNLELIKLLLSKGANINDHDGKGNTVLTAAQESKNEDVIKFVKERAEGK